MKSYRALTWVLVTALLAGASTALAQAGSQALPEPATAASEKDRATQSHVGKGESRKAAREYEVQARARPSDPAPKVGAAKIYEAMGDLVAAKAAANEALGLDANNVEALLVLGRIAARQQQWDVAVAHFRRATTVSPDNAAAQLDLGQALEKIGDREGSETAYATHRQLRGLPALPLDEEPPSKR